jgi:hypothetical protein
LPALIQENEARTADGILVMRNRAAVRRSILARVAEGLFEPRRTEM